MLTINQKAEELYEKRIAPYAVNISPSQKDVLIEFQKLIFKMDYYFESIKDINLAYLDSQWKLLEHSLDTLKVEKSVQISLLQDIKEYAAMEAATRTGKKLLEYAIDSFYFKKSCDVRLQRHLIRHLNNEAVTSSAYEINRDVLEEIEDDIDDIEEDMQTLFNGNRFLEALKWRDDTKINEYIVFVKSLEHEHRDLVARVLKKISGRVGSV